MVHKVINVNEGLFILIHKYIVNRQLLSLRARRVTKERRI